MLPSDEALLESWRAGDRAAGEALLRRHFDSLYAFFRGKLDDRGIVADLVQRTMLATFRGRQGFRSDASFRTWLFTIARHELFAVLRKAQKQPETIDFGDVSVAQLSGAGPSTVLGRLQDAKQLVLALRRIPLELQIVIELTYWESMSASEVAIVLDIPVGTVKSRIRRAREALHEAMVASGTAAREAHETMEHLEAWAARVREAARAS